MNAVAQLRQERTSQRDPITQTGEHLLAQGELAAAYAAKQMVRYEHILSAWRAEWLRIAGENEEIRQALKPALPRLAPAITFELVEDE